MSFAQGLDNLGAEWLILTQRREANLFDIGHTGLPEMIPIPICGEQLHLWLPVSPWQ